MQTASNKTFLKYKVHFVLLVIITEVPLKPPSVEEIAMDVALAGMPFAEIATREDKDVLLAIRQSLAHLEINGPNTIIAGLPDGRMITCCDSKKLRPVVVGGDDTTIAISSEVCGINEILPDRNMEKDIYPNEREVVVIDNDLKVMRWKQ